MSERKKEMNVMSREEERKKERKEAIELVRGGLKERNKKCNRERKKGARLRERDREG